MTDQSLSRMPAGARDSSIRMQQFRVAPQQSAPRRRSQPGASLARLKVYLAAPFSAELWFSVAVIGALYYSWINRHEGHLTPETGAGYWLGIVGSSMMGLLLLYPLRKRLRSLVKWGRTPSWFRWHMILGIVGPALIMVHSNWTLASVNATVATVAMLIVVASGVIGRYLYTKVHMGLYGRKADVRQILADTTHLKELLGGDLPQTEQLIQELQAFEARVLTPRQGFISQTLAFLVFGIRRLMFRGRIMRQVNATIASEAKRQGWTWATRRKRQALVREHLQIYCGALTKAVRLSVFERLFAAWHVLHMPLFFLLVAAVIVHIIAVHRY